MLTTIQAAALLTARGYTDREGGPVQPATVQKWCQRGQLAALRVGEGRRAQWLISEDDLAAFQPPARERKERSDKGQAHKKR